jgi:hypothetical protein
VGPSLPQLAAAIVVAFLICIVLLSQSLNRAAENKGTVSYEALGQL